MAEPAEKLDEVEAPAQDTEPTEVPESVKPVGLNRFGLAAEKRNQFLVNVPHGTNPDLALEPDFWTHVSRHLGRGDVVTIEPDDLAWEMSVKVLDRGINWANVRKREFFEYGSFEVMPETPTKYKVEWAGQTDMFRVCYEGEVIKSGFATEELARRFAANHAQALKR